MPKPIPEGHDGVKRLAAVVHDLRAPGGCPWDREQTHQSLLPNLIEEAYEAVEAIGAGAAAAMTEELGDLLLQIVMHAEIASESGAFTLDRIAHEIADKLIRRHPHVYGASTAGTSDAVLEQWDAIKHRERGSQAPTSTLAGVGRGLPALARAAKLQRKAARVGFDWPDSTGVLAKIREELAELENEPTGSAARAREIGDLLFTVANLARKEGHDPEILCAAANEKFVSRFAAMERRLAESNRPPGTASLEEMESAWQAAKAD